MTTRKNPHEHGLHEALALMSRRRMLRILGGVSLLPLAAACGGASTGTNGAACSVIPTETGGPYPADGSNNGGLSALTQTGIVRTDLRSSFGSLSGTATGVPLKVTLTLVNVNSSCALLSGYAIYLWHCNINGQYSLYTIANQNYLRGVAETDANGQVTFTTVFPAAYDGRWPHMHFEIFTSLANATAGAKAITTSQLALPKAQCDEVYATPGYEKSVSNLAKTSLSSDMVFSDGANLQLPSMSGSVGAGYTADLTVGVAG